MGAHFGALLDDHYAEFLAAFLGDLAEPAGGCQTGGAGADDDYVDFH
ncbi:hypothetical protein GCM10023339_70380 [Alloalcanivorax gelatiniphagus]